MSHLATSKFEQWRSAEGAAQAAERRFNNKTLRAVTAGGPTPTADELQEMLDLRKLAAQRLTDYIEETRLQAQALRSRW